MKKYNSFKDLQVDVNPQAAMTIDQRYTIKKQGKGFVIRDTLYAFCPLHITTFFDMEDAIKARDVFAWSFYR